LPVQAGRQPAIAARKLDQRPVKRR
jgi:hypothetical protein